MIKTPIKTTDYKRVQLVLAPGASEVVERIASARDLTVAATIRRAIALLNIVYEVVDNGGKILVEQDGTTREVTLL